MGKWRAEHTYVIRSTFNPSIAKFNMLPLSNSHSELRYGHGKVVVKIAGTTKGHAHNLDLSKGCSNAVR